MAASWTVLIAWGYSDDDCFFDTDEVQVRAGSAGEAICAATQKWLAEVAPQWPGITIESVSVAY